MELFSDEIDMLLLDSSLVLNPKCYIIICNKICHFYNKNLETPIFGKINFLYNCPFSMT